MDHREPNRRKNPSYKKRTTIYLVALKPLKVQFVPFVVFCILASVSCFSSSLVVVAFEATGGEDYRTVRMTLSAGVVVLKAYSRLRTDEH